VANLVAAERIFVLTNAAFVPLVREQLPEVPAANIIGEPLRRDTAAAIALAALLCEKRLGNPLMAILTADHLIEPVELFQQTLLSAAAAVQQTPGASSPLYTFGIEPSYPATGFGYLQRGRLLLSEGGIDHYELRRFCEKPDRARAEEFLLSKEYYWNSGMFVWSTSGILEQFRRHLPEHLRQLEPAVAREGDPQWPRMLADAFAPLQKISIDFGIMEKAEEVRCVASHFDWDDVGGWLALERFLDHDASDNYHRGRVFVEDAQRNLVFCEDPQQVVALLGVEQLVVVHSPQGILIVNRHRTEDIKKLVQKLDEGSR
jgi:mannose-1-phosphate guanylyltransferase